MKNLVFNENGAVLTNSLLVAEKFGKRHANVIKAVEDHISDLKATDSKISWFCKSEYYDAKGEIRKMYVMNQDGFSLLVMSFNNTKDVLRFKLDFIEAFNQMKKALANKFTIPQSFSEALRLAAEQADTIEKQQVQIESQKPKVLFAESVEKSESSCLVGELAKILNQNGVDTGATRLFEWMRSNGYLCSRGEQYNQPTQRAMDLGLFELVKRTIGESNGCTKVVCTTKVTGKGQIYFTNKFLKKTA